MVVKSPVSFGVEVDLISSGLELLGTADQMLALSVGDEVSVKPQELACSGDLANQVPVVAVILAGFDR